MSLLHNYTIRLYVAAMIMEGRAHMPLSFALIFVISYVRARCGLWRPQHSKIRSECRFQFRHLRVSRLDIRLARGSSM